MVTNQNIVIMNRWSDDYGNYAILLDHHQNNVSYIVNAGGAVYLKNHPEIPNYAQVVNDLKDVEEVSAAMDHIISRFGKIDVLIALSENDILVAGQMRDRYSIQGMGLQDTLRFIDKVEMKKSFAGTKVAVPRYLEDLTEKSLLDFVSETGFPVVLKPRTGAASAGVKIIPDRERLMATMKEIDIHTYECEEYIEGPIFHMDGIMKNGELVFVRTSRYLNTCYEYTQGKPVGSIIISDEQRSKKFADFTEEVMKTLRLDNGVFHLEAILRDGNEPVFLELGARQGGGEVVPLMRLLYDVDLVRALFQSQLGEEIEVAPRKTPFVSGFLLFPEPKEVPCKVVKVSTVENLSTLSYEYIPEVDSILDGKGGYYFNAGKFAFIGREEDIESDLLRAMNEYEIVTEPIS
ncbi:ATP-grasp domain-containing protein [Thermoactinomyces sp. DSM 45891]|uniref:ATP-grasp domain-containing protein n=1 Tax=Thermoactinomyces sp. DSM 45891 TaxID=1761907 RepID=UPI000916EBBA|nr:ATP-grasp domain-containing protein [Thermoactinomyces sp. DSM 45891]SFX61821.1 ATP-grasp domain-containing protein [Thermoactinomyces sp. DSM 45891]